MANKVKRSPEHINTVKSINKKMSNIKKVFGKDDLYEDLYYKHIQWTEGIVLTKTGRVSINSADTADLKALDKYIKDPSFYYNSVANQEYATGFTKKKIIAEVNAKQYVDWMLDEILSEYYEFEEDLEESLNYGPDVYEAKNAIDEFLGETGSSSPTYVELKGMIDRVKNFLVNYG